MVQKKSSMKLSVNWKPRYESVIQQVPDEAVIYLLNHATFRCTLFWNPSINKNSIQSHKAPIRTPFLAGDIPEQILQNKN